MLESLTEAAMAWGRSTYQCSASSHAYLFVLVAGWILIAAGGVYAWFWLNKPKGKRVSPLELPLRKQNQSLEH